MSSEIEKEVYLVLRRLRLDSPVFAQILAIEKLVNAVELTLEKEAKKGTGYGDLIWRAINHELYPLFASPDMPADLQNEAYQWLGEYFYRRLVPRLHNDLALAQDLTNQSLEKVFISIKSCQRPEAFLSWATQICVREMLQHYRKYNRKPGLSNNGKNPIETSSDIKAPDDHERETDWQDFHKSTHEVSDIGDNNLANPETIYLRLEQISSIIENVARLKTTTRRSQDYKTILYGTYILGLTDQELALRLSISPQEVQKRRYQALQLLRREKEWLNELR